MTAAIRHHSKCPRNEHWTPMSGVALSLEPATPAPVAATAENQQHDENDEKGCRVHVALLWIREPTTGSLHQL
jgi:hypothetical protein